MAVDLKSLDELTTWEEYRAFMKERLKQLPDGECRFFLSKKKLDFHDNGKQWKGRAVLVGPKGELVVKKIKKDGVQFLEGTCTPSGKELSVAGIEALLLKGAALTLKRMKLGYSIAGVDASDEPDGSASASEAPAVDPEAASIEAERQELLAALAEAKKLNEPANKGILAQVEKALEAVKSETDKKNYAKARALIGAIESQLSMVVEGGDVAGDPDLTMLGDWKEYRTFLKAQLKRMPKEGGPTFVSRERQTFSIGGQEFKGNAILFGPKARIAVAALKRQGILFMEGVGRIEGLTLKLSGIKRSLIKGATKTMIKLRLGKRIVPEGHLPAEDETSDKAQDGSTGKRSLDKQVKEIAEALAKLREAVEKQKKAVPGLEKLAKDKKKNADDLTAKAKKAGGGARKEWADANNAKREADAAHFAAKNSKKAAGRADNDLRELVERLQRIRDSADSDGDKKTQLKKLKSDVAAMQLDATIANIDVNDPKAGKLIAKQIEKRFGVKFKLNESKILGRDAQGNQIFKDNAKKVNPKKEAETLKELYLTLAKAPVFPESHLKKLTVSLRPSNSESEGGVYYGSSKTAEITCRRPKESFDYGAQLNSSRAFPGGVDPDCQAANKDPVNYFDWATLHEVAHAVDAKYKFMDSRKSQAKYGSWIEYGNNVAPVAAAAAGEFGKSLSEDDRKKLESYATKRMKAAPGGGPAPSTPEETQVQQWVDAVRVTKGLWWNGAQTNARAIGSPKRVYQEAYEGGWWNSYDLAARRQGIHGYQFRAPGEWFAELYAAYYSDKLKPSHPIVADLAKLEVPKK